MALDSLITPRSILIDTTTGQATSELFRFINDLIESLGVAGALVGDSDVQTLTNKTIDGDNNTLSDIATSSLKTRTGQDAAVVTGTAGTSGNVASWDANGDVIGGGVAVNALATLTGSQTLTNKTLTSPTINTPTLATPTVTGVLNLPSYTVAGVPAAASNTGAIIFVSNESGGAQPAWSNGTNWLRFTDGATIS